MNCNYNGVDLYIIFNFEIIILRNYSSYKTYPNEKEKNSLLKQSLKKLNSMLRLNE